MNDNTQPDDKISEEHESHSEDNVTHIRVPSEESHIKEQLTEAAKFAEDIRVRCMNKAQFRRFVTATIGIIALIGSTGYFGWTLIVEGRLILGILAILASLILTLILNIWAAMPIKAYKAQYKKDVMPRLAKAIGGFSYAPKRGISRKLIEKTKLLPKCKYYTAEDCFTGHYKGHKIMLSEARLGQSPKQDTLIFDGLFVLMQEKEKRFEGHSIITADPFQFNRLSKHLKSYPIDNNLYNEHFKIFSNSDKDATQFNNDHLLKELLDAYKAFDKAPLSVCFFGERYVFFMIANKTDMFEPSSMNMPVTTVESTMQVKRELEKILEIIDVLHVL